MLTVLKILELHASIKVRITETIKNSKGTFETKTSLQETTAGRVILWNIVPKGLSFNLVNRVMKKKPISHLLNTCYRVVGLKETVVFADQMMYLGFNYATISGTSIGVNDFVIPDEKESIINLAYDEVREIENQFVSGLVTQGEKYNKVIDIWSKANEFLARKMMDNLESDRVENAKGQTVNQESFNSVYMMADSGARGSAAQIRQLAGMRGTYGKARRFYYRNADYRKL